ncbi:mCG1041962 [Mus musculus]|nr:mCG1041962 [Mus musculus]
MAVVYKSSYPMDRFCEDQQLCLQTQTKALEDELKHTASLAAVHRVYCGRLLCLGDPECFLLEEACGPDLDRVQDLQGGNRVMIFHAEQLISAKLQRIKHKSVEGEDVWQGFQGPFGGIIILELKDMTSVVTFVLGVCLSSTQCTSRPSWNRVYGFWDMNPKFLHIPSARDAKGYEHHRQVTLPKRSLFSPISFLYTLLSGVYGSFGVNALHSTQHGRSSGDDQVQSQCHSVDVMSGPSTHYPGFYVLQEMPTQPRMATYVESHPSSKDIF